MHMRSNAQDIRESVGGGMEGGGGLKFDELVFFPGTTLTAEESFRGRLMEGVGMEEDGGGGGSDQVIAGVVEVGRTREEWEDTSGGAAVWR